MTTFSNVKCVGMHFRGQEMVEAASMLETAENISFEREPDNAYDAYAIKIMLGEAHMGYISRDVAAWISPLLDEGQVITSVEFVGHETIKNNKHPLFNIEVG